MDKLNIGVTVDTSSAVDGLQKVSSSIDKVATASEKNNALQVNSARLIAQNEAESRKFIAALQEEASNIGKSRDQMLAYRAAQLGVTQEAKAFIDQIKQGGMKDATNHMHALGESAELAKHSLELLGVAMSVHALKEFIMGSIEAQVQLGHMSEKLSIAVEDLAAYKVVAELSGTTLDGFATGIKKLSVFMVEHKDRLKEAGITATDTNGAMVQLANIFHDMPEGPERTALAVKLFGRSGLDLIPILVRGGDALTELMEKGKRLNPVTEEMTKQARLFHEQSIELQSSASRFALMLTSEMLPKMNEITKAMIEAQKEGGSLKALWVGFGGAATTIFNPLIAIFKTFEVSAVELAQSIDLAMSKITFGSVKSAYIKDAAEMVITIKRLYSEIAKLGTNQPQVPQNAESAKPSKADQSAAHRKAAALIGAEKSPSTTAYESQFQALGAEKAKMDDEIAQYEQFGRVVEKSRLAVLNFQIAQGKLTGLSPSQIIKLRSMATANDEEAQRLTSIKNTVALKDKVAVYEAEAKAQVGVKEATKDAILMAELENQKTVIGAKAYQELAERIHTATAEKQLHDAQAAIQSGEGKTSDAVKKLNEEASLIGKSVLERQKLVEVLKIEAWQRQELAKVKGNAQAEGAINNSAKKQIDEMSAALDHANAVQREWATGAQSAFKNYTDNATNAASQASKVFTDGLMGMENALVSFVQTGKLNFTSMANSIIADMIRIMVQAQITAPLSGAMSGIFGFGSSATAGPSAASGGGSWLPMGIKLPSFDVGSPYVPSDMVAQIHKGEAIIPANRNSTQAANGDTYYIDATGADAAGLARLENTVRVMNGSIERRAVAAAINSRKRQPLAWGA